jgi:hypothetical protein
MTTSPSARRTLASESPSKPDGSDFAHFWDEEPSPLERRKLIATLLERVWQDEGHIVAVRPRKPFVRYFRTMGRLNTPPRRRGVKGGSDGTRTRDLRRDRPAF